MSIGGGTYLLENKVLPGAYINFVGHSTANVAGERGIVSFPLVMNWGVEGEIIKMDAADFSATSTAVLGYAPTADEVLLVREAFKRASKVLLYRANPGGVKASKSIGGITVTAVCSGTRGNDIKVGVMANVDNGSLFDVVTYLETTEVDRQTVEDAASLVANDWVTFSAGTLAIAAAFALTGGTNGTADGTSYAAYLTALEVEDFNTVAYPGTDATTKGLFDAFVTRLREANGQKVVGVLYQHAADHEGLVSVKNGVILADGTTVTGDKAVVWVAAASAAAEINESLTNAVYDGAVDTDVRYTRTAYEAAIKAGEFVFYGEAGAARVLADINSLVTVGGGKTADMTSNRVMRVLDGWANDVSAIFGRLYLGTQTNNDTGRQLFKADLVALAQQYQRVGAISDFVPDDISIAQGTEKRDVVVGVSLKPNDAMEKLYMLVQVA